MWVCKLSNWGEQETKTDQQMISEVVLLKPKAKCMMSQDSREAQNKEQFPMKATLVADSDEIQHKNVATGAVVNKATKASVFKPFGAHIVWPTFLQPGRKL